MQRRKWTRDKLNAIEQLLAEGKGYKDIADEMGTTEVNIRQVIHTYKLKSKSHRGALVKSREKKKRDIAHRLMVLQGLEVKKPEDVKPFTDEELLRWIKGARGCNRFCSDLVKVKMQPFQREMTEIALESRRACFVIGRGAGKDYWASLYALWGAVIRPTRTLIVSAAQRQSDLLMGRIHDHILKSDQLFASVRTSNMEKLTLTNSSEIVSLPSTGHIRGYQDVDLIIANECAFIPNSREVVEGTLLPMLGTKRGSLVLMSTPLTCGNDDMLWMAYNNKLFSKLKYPASVSSYISKEFLEEQKRLLTFDRYRREYLADFVDVSNAFFDSRVIDRQTDDYLMTEIRDPAKRYYFGWDAARFRDASVLCVVSKDKDKMLRVEYIHAFRGKAFPEQEAMIKRLHAIFKPIGFVAEYAGLSMGSVDHLIRDGIRVTKFVPTAPEKMKAFDGLKLKLEQGALTLPMHDKLLTELRFFQFKVTPAGNVLLHHIPGQGDDYADALCFAVKAAAGPGVIIGLV
jgi:hypothetical protein